MGFIWTDDNIKSLREMCANPELSFRDIGDALGCSRNAAIGKAGRLGIQSATSRATVAAKIKEGALKSAFVRRARNSFVPREDPPLPPPVITEAIPLHLSIMELASRTCRWPYGDGPFTYCGCETASDAVYCAAHMEISVNRGPVRVAVRGRGAKRNRAPVSSPAFRFEQWASAI